MLEWIKAHPEDLIFVLGVATTLFNWVTKPRTPEELAAYPARLAAFFRFMNATFPDPQKMTESLWQLWKNTHERMPPKE